MKITQKIVTCAISFLLALMLCAWAVVGSVLPTVYSPSFVEKYADGAYTDAAYDALMESWSNLGQPALIPQEVFERALPRTQFAAYMHDYLTPIWETGAYSGRPDADEVRSALMTTFEAYAEEVNTPITQSLTDALTQLTNACVEKYHTHTNVPGIDSVFLALLTTKNVVLIAFAGLSVLVLLLGWTTLRIGRYWGGGLRPTCYGLLATVPTLSAPAIWLLLSDPLAKANLNPPHLRLPLMAIANDIATLWLAVAAGAAVLGVLFILLTEIPRRKKF